MPYRCEWAALKFNAANPCSIQSYFEDLNVLFIRHQVSDSSEKKRTAVRYTNIEVERLWKLALSFSDPACSYEDFTAEIIGMYPEASAEHQYTIPQLQQLVSDHAHTPIQLEKELTDYYHQFRIISYNLITMCHIGVLEQVRHFLAGFEPSLASDIHSRLEAKLPDHFPSDPYKIEDVFQAALHTLRIQACAPPIPPPRDVLLPPTRPLDATTSSQIPLQAAPTFPTTPEHPSSVRPALIITVQVPTDQQCTPLSWSPHDNVLLPTAVQTSLPPPEQTPTAIGAFPLTQTHCKADSVSNALKTSFLACTPLATHPPHVPSPPTVALASPLQFERMLPMIKAFPLAQALMQADPVSETPRSSFPAAMLYIPPLHCVLPPPMSAQSSRWLAQSVPTRFLPFPTRLEALQQAQTAPTLTQADTADARLQALFQAVAALGADLQSFIEGQEVIKQQAVVQRTRQKKGPCCKFCGDIGHIIKACQEVDKYVCIGKCKQDIAGRIVLPSGADIPYAANCKTLQQRCDKYHQQKPSLQAGMIRLRQNDVASWWNLGLQESRQATPV